MKRADAAVIGLFILSFPSDAIKFAVETLEEDFSITFDDLMVAVRELEATAKMNGEVGASILGGMTVDEDDDDEDRIPGDEPIEDEEEEDEEA